jgi:hypothetical protein
MGLKETAGFQVITVWSMKISVVWLVAPCSLVEIDVRFRGAYCRHHQGDRPDDEGVSTFETSDNFYETTRRQQPRRQSSL